LIKLAPFARERGLSMLAIDLLGERSDDDLDRILRRRLALCRAPTASTIGVAPGLPTSSVRSASTKSVVWGRSWLRRMTSMPPTTGPRRLPVTRSTSGAGALSIKNIPTGPGDNINLQAVYTDGATRYNFESLFPESFVVCNLRQPRMMRARPLGR
jgi:hypothetical protein